MRTSEFDYELPVEFIAQQPVEPRDSSRLLVLNRKGGEIRHSFFSQIGDFLNPGDLLVLNDTRVFRARLYARKIPTSGRVEILLLTKLNPDNWEVLVGGKGLISGSQVEIEGGPRGEIVTVLSGARRIIQFLEPVEPYLDQIGHIPLPPYIHTPLADFERYQTVYSQFPGSTAAPTAGLHFTKELIANLQNKGILFVQITLHVGLDTFAPVTEVDPETHEIHSEWCAIEINAARQINRVREEGGKVVAVGTTSVRTLESAVQDLHSEISVGEWSGSTNLFILPGYHFQIVDAMVTNFHLPRSTLIMLVSAFAGREQILKAYEIAKRESYRFYSFGDAMLIL